MGYTVKKKPGQHLFYEVNYMQIEAHTGCTRRCDFCGIMHDRPHHPMELELFKNIVDQLTPKTKRMSFSLGGEPLLNNELVRFIEYARAKLPKTQLSLLTNFDVITKKDQKIDRILELYDAGINIIQADLYDSKSWEQFKEIIGTNKNEFHKRNISPFNYNIGGFNAWSYHGVGNKYLIYCYEHDDFNYGTLATRRFHTWAGNMPSEFVESKGLKYDRDFPLEKPCCEPLCYMAIESNGHVMLCCPNGPKSTNIGNVYDNGVYDIWRSEIFHKYRYALKIGRRDLIPQCYFCNKRTFRNGLYVYWGWKEYDLEELAELFSSEEQFNMRSVLRENLIKYKDVIRNPYLVRRIEREMSNE